MTPSWLKSSNGGIWTHANAEVQRIWDRYVWLVDRSDALSDDLVTLLLGRLTDTADVLGDHDLVAFARGLMGTVFSGEGG